MISLEILLIKDLGANTNTRPNYEKADFNKMRETLNLDWDKVFQQCPDDVNKQCKIFVNIYKELESKFVPRKICEVPKRKCKTPLDKKALSKIKRKKIYSERSIKTNPKNCRIMQVPNLRSELGCLYLY